MNKYKRAFVRLLDAAFICTNAIAAPLYFYSAFAEDSSSTALQRVAFFLIYVMLSGILTLLLFGPREYEK